jgi:hypothetical protein
LLYVAVGTMHSLHLVINNKDYWLLYSKYCITHNAALVALELNVVVVSHGYSWQD